VKGEVLQPSWCRPSVYRRKKRKKLRAMPGKLRSVGEDAYSTSEAAKILRWSNRRVLQLLEEGALEGYKDAAGRWHIHQASVHALLEGRPSRVAPERTQETPEALRDRLEELQRQLGRVEGARELEAVARSTLEDSLRRERERADRLEEELREARRSWWRRLLG
jgi:excisionase family DNA binding protein